ncbi:MAG: ribonuclease P protein component [Deltaproteobacteria bacterium]|nr:ribonuclease P protein component [Deltaproteobacteria bacterium]MBW2076020.1 ribonuclease P protein component [Deltaproteobacteria bacterium]MBW2309489.1 ribonuclease P protein component [Deltaproteobacteria bacterium]RLB30461.1 MAG: ribonuclease P protein component [Deltaproteobacteria bacterium]
MRSSSLTKKERILKRADFIDINLHGRRFRTENYIIIVRPNGEDITRLGITANKRVGNSAKRNRLKRLIREFFRHHKHDMPKGYDVVIVPVHEIQAPSLSKVHEELGSVLVKNGTLFS